MACRPVAARVLADAAATRPGIARYTYKGGRCRPVVADRGLSSLRPCVLDRCGRPCRMVRRRLRAGMSVRDAGRIPGCPGPDAAVNTGTTATASPLRKLAGVSVSTPPASCTSTSSRRPRTCCGRCSPRSSTPCSARTPTRSATPTTASAPVSARTGATATGTGTSTPAPAPSTSPCPSCARRRTSPTGCSSDAAGPRPR